ncbi:hypothetical protein NFI96_033134 [Prochilodus magdalenae]|nr:hypothetical protein NFI96_033134 [Prochilodus magdalenae]
MTNTALCSSRGAIVSDCPSTRWTSKMLRATALSGNEDQRMDQEVLDRIINHLHKYRPADGNQFAMAISIPAEYCDGKSKLDFHFLNRDDPYEVKDETTRLHLYEGVDMIVATPRDDGKGNKLHSEHLLLNHPDTEQSPMKGLLDMDKDSAVIFYTYNSPCKHTCLNEDVDRNILKSLPMFKQHRGPKAFVYNQVFRGDDEDLEEHLGKINEGSGTGIWKAYNDNQLMDSDVERDKKDDSCQVLAPGRVQHVAAGTLFSPQVCNSDTEGPYLNICGPITKRHRRTLDNNMWCRLWHHPADEGQVALVERDEQIKH